MNRIPRVILTIAGLLPSQLTRAPAQEVAAAAHVSNTFHFVVSAPISQTAPLFGPEGERCWAGEHWRPEFIYPHPGKDIQGAVLIVTHGDHKSVWVNTVFDIPGGHMQYVSLVPGALVFTVEVKLKVIDTSKTSVEVTYVRTALDPAWNEHVRSMGTSDAASGPGWQHDIGECLKRSRS